MPDEVKPLSAEEAEQTPYSYIYHHDAEITKLKAYVNTQTTMITTLKTKVEKLRGDVGRLTGELDAANQHIKILSNQRNATVILLRSVLSDAAWDGLPNTLKECVDAAYKQLRDENERLRGVLQSIIQNQEDLYADRSLLDGEHCDCGE